MNIPTKFALSALAASTFACAGASADDLRWVQMSNHHGSHIGMYWRGDEAPTVAVYAQGQGISSNSTGTSEPQFRMNLRDDHHGHFLPVYRFEE